ncbi:hypothetical protein FZC66_09210 [Priestia megaterium]|nr:hypothetical protein FZC66_09210 [Priestia megaterium]
MISKIKKVKLEKDGKNPNYKVLLECPENHQLYIHFDYTYATGSYWPKEVHYKRKHRGAKLAWYTREIENMTVENFLKEIAERINKKYDFTLK